MTKTTKTTKATATDQVSPVDYALNELPTTSARIRYLDSEGLSRSEIAKALGKRYQHVRNVLITPIGQK